jgi:phosphatidylglycerol:prolipoprotein diacylglycerol transferase
MSTDDLVNLFLWLIIGLLLGARLFATLIYDPSGYYFSHPWMIFWPFRDGRFVGLLGMSYHGGVVGAVVGGLLFARRHRYNFFQLADLIIAGVPLGYTFGRLGNFFNGELWGRVTARSWGMVFPYAESFSSKYEWVREIAGRIGMPYQEGAMVNLPRHPSQLYEACFEGVFLWLIIWFIVRQRKKFHGQIISIYIMGYGLIRFFIEYFREPDADLGFVFSFGAGSESTALLLSFWNFSMGQVLSSIMIAAGAVLYLLLRKRYSADMRSVKGGRGKFSGATAGKGPSRKLTGRNVKGSRKR